MTNFSSLSLLGWSVGRRLALVLAAMGPLWLAVGWALDWWGW